jgi:hypothetical protein
MLQPTLIIGAIFSLASAGIYFYVGRSLSRRHVATQDARLAWNLFVTWWYALAGTTFAGGVLSLLGATGITDLPLFLTFTQVNLLTICVALHGLIYYLLYLFTGSRKVLAPLTIFYIVYYILLTYYINFLEPISVSVGKWSTTLKYQQSATGPFFTVVLILLVVPQVIAGIAYFTLYFRVKEITQKYRVAVVSWSIIIWFLSTFIASISGLSQYDWWQITSRLIGLSATLAILMAYQPIPWIKQRLGVASIAEESA